MRSISGRNTARKSQAALEFLTTYGWALLIILLMIGSLAYFGILSPSRLLPDRCNLGSEMKCLNSIIGELDDGSGILRLKLKNNLPDQIIATSFETSSDSSTPFGCTVTPIGTTWASGEVKDIEFLGCNNKASGVVQGTKSKVSFKMKYYREKTSPAYQKEIDGEIYAAVNRVSSILTYLPECSDFIDNDPPNGCVDYVGGDTGCDSPTDDTESGGTCPGSTGQSDPLNCFVSVACNNPYVTVFKMSSLSDAHAEVPSQTNFDYKVCCRSSLATETLSSDCNNPNPPNFIALHLSAITDANVEQNNQNNYNVNVCLSTTSTAQPPKTILCTYRSNCLSGETCMASISDITDAHVADCITQPFATKVCCKIQ